MQLQVRFFLLLLFFLFVCLCTHALIRKLPLFLFFTHHSYYLHFLLPSRKANSVTGGKPSISSSRHPVATNVVVPSIRSAQTYPIPMALAEKKVSCNSKRNRASSDSASRFLRYYPSSIDISLSSSSLSVRLYLSRYGCLSVSGWLSVCQPFSVAV